jgi:thiol-disulfide isomerase/thioredoxin
MKPLEDLNFINNNDYQVSQSYKSLVLSHFLNQESIDNNINDHFKDLIESNANDIKKDVVFQGKYSLRASSDNNEVLYNALTALSNDSTQISELTDLYNKLSIIKEGMKSPEFINYENYKGGTTSLSDLKGKYVYIDVWATWCGPCIAEIPSLKKVEKLYHNKNIEFVSISIDVRDRPVYNYDKWRQMIEEKSLGGVQLFADNAWDSKFTKAFVINSIPRFLLIDPDGNIVSGDAPRPSDQKLIEMFDSLGI